MLLQFSVSNYRGLRELQTLNLAASGYDKTLPENTVERDFPGLKGKRWLKGIALYGANASGKTTIIKAIKALSDWIGNSAKMTDPERIIRYIDPFALDPASSDEPTAFGITFIQNGVRFEYRVAATKKLVIHESLRAWPAGYEQIWFERDWDSNAGKHVFSPENPKGLPRNRDIEERTLRNMLYLSKAVAEARKEVEPVFHWLVHKLQFLDLSTRTSLRDEFTLRQLERENDELKSKIIQILRHADIGISDALAIEGTPLRRKIFDLLKKRKLEMLEPLTLDKNGDEHIRFMQPQLFHRGPQNTSTPLDWKSESAGTQRLFSLIGPLLDILKNGYTLCIDEIETSMHPIMVRELLKLFFSEKENAGGAQIIFTTHNPLFLDSTLIRRDQVWFTDKDEEGAVHLYPLSDYKPRGGESLIRGYMAGRYGAIPFVPRGLLGTFPAGENVVSGGAYAEE